MVLGETIYFFYEQVRDFAKNSSCHRTTIAHFLNSGILQSNFSHPSIQTVSSHK